jgi:diguanylate cyclase (GGDEF)-like protein/PAS domain S-box-containing protein
MTTSPPSPPLPRPKILIVDDFHANLVALRRLLAKVDAEVIAAGSGNEALALTLDHDFAVVLLDVQMPDIDGYEVAELLRGEERTRKVPIIFLTAAYKGDEHRLKGYESGAVDYMEKPINDVILLSKVSIFIDLHQSQSKLERLLHLLEHTNHRLSIEIEERRRSEQESQQLAGTVFANSAEGIMVCDADNKVQAVNPAFTGITGYSPGDIIGKNPSVLSSGRHDGQFYADLWSQLQQTGRWQGEIWDRRKSGEVFPEWLSISVIRNADGSIARYVAIFTDITKRKQGEEQIWRQANFDNLTGLPNRALFHDRLSRAVADARRERHGLALMFVDLDRFKLVNDTLGHALGDLLLQQAASRLSGCVRENDTVSRLGGDEFTIILKGVEAASNAALVAEKVIATLSTPFCLDGNDASIGGSIGISLFPDDAEDDRSLLRTADMAMYRAKESGRNTFAFFTGEMGEKTQNLALFGNELRNAIKRNELLVHYQPIMDARTLAVRGAEALVRWQHPRLGLMPPREFIPLAEETGIIGPLTDWVLQTACRDAVAWQRPGRPPLSVAINLSNQQVNLSNFADHTSRVLADTGLSPDLLKFEITEDFAIEQGEKMLTWLRMIHDIGIGLSINDFGAGYSSFSYLRRLPIDIVKIDRLSVNWTSMPTMRPWSRP